MILSSPLCKALDEEPDIAVLIDGRGIICFVNRAWNTSAEQDQAHATYRAEALLGRGYLDFVAGDLDHLRQRGAAVIDRLALRTHAGQAPNRRCLRSPLA